MGSMVSVGLAKPKRSASRELTSLALSEAVIVCARVALLRLASSPAVISWRWAVSIVEFFVWARMGRQMGSNRWRMHGILLRASTVRAARGQSYTKADPTRDTPGGLDGTAEISPAHRGEDVRRLVVWGGPCRDRVGKPGFAGRSARVYSHAR